MMGMDFEPYDLDRIQRKLRISNKEDYSESAYRSDEVAAYYQFWQKTEGPFLIVPTTAKPDTPGQFSLSIFSSAPIQMKRLEDSKNVVISGEWYAYIYIYIYI